MCGRYSFDTEIDALIAAYRLQKQRIEWERKTEIRPTDSAPVLLSDGRLAVLRWGFSFPFAKRPLINARGETAARKPLFAEAFARRRCVIPATAYYEWKADASGQKEKYRIRSDESILSMAGMWQTFQDEQNNAYPAFVVITTNANAFVEPIHHRMPVLLTPEDIRLYLNHHRMQAADWERMISCSVRLHAERAD